MQTAGDSSLQKQVLSLGASFDTTFFQLQETKSTLEESMYNILDPKPRVFYEEGKALALYVELDFKEVTSKKVALIDSYEQLRNKLGRTTSISQEKGEVQSEHYKLLPVDLHDIKGLDAVFNLAKLDPSLPTFILAKCVLIYIEPYLSRMLVRWAADKF